MIVLSLLENNLRNVIISNFPKTKKITEIDPENGNVNVRIENININQIINNSPFLQMQIKIAVETVKYIKNNSDVVIKIPLNVITPMGPGSVVANQIIPKSLE